MFKEGKDLSRLTGDQARSTAQQESSMHLAKTSPTARWLVLLALLLVLLATAMLTDDAAAADDTVRFTNLTDKRIYIAVASFDPGCVSCGPLKLAQNPSVTLDGWKYLEPGISRNFSAGYFHLTFETSVDGYLSWPGYPDQILLIHPTDNYRSKRVDLVKQADGSLQLDFSQNSSAHKLIKYEGFKTATFQKIDSGHLSISGANQVYKITNQTFNHDFQSSGLQTHQRCFNASGNVADIRWDTDQHWVTGLIWDEHSDKVCLTVITEGRQVEAFGGREESFFVGWVEVHYTDPLR